MRNNIVFASGMKHPDWSNVPYLYVNINGSEEGPFLPSSLIKASENRWRIGWFIIPDQGGYVSVRGVRLDWAGSVWVDGQVYADLTPGNELWVHWLVELT